MMNTKLCLRVVLFAVLTTIVLQIVHAGYDDPGDDWSSSTSQEEGGDDGDSDTDWSGREEGEGEDSDIYDPTINPGAKFSMEMRIYCHDSERDGSNGGRFVVNDEITKIGSVYGSDYDSDIDEFFPFLPYAHEYLPYIYGFEYVEPYLSWVFPITRQIKTSEEVDFDDAKLHRFEGSVDESFVEWDETGCVPYVAVKYTVNYTSEESWFAFDAWGNLRTKADIDADNFFEVKYNDNEDIGYNIEWDDNQDDCEAINSSWYSGSSYTDGTNSYRCCGDDRMWLYNRAVTEGDGFENPQMTSSDLNEFGNGDVTMSSFCLYGPGDVGVDMSWSWYDDATNQYLCEPTLNYGFESYDLNFELDDSYDPLDSSASVTTQDSPFVFQGSDNMETDIGKWSDSSGQNPQFCYYTQDDTLGETYNWIDVNTIGEMPVNDQGETIIDFSDEAYRASTICEQYLGGKWTGSHCCGNKYSYSTLMYVDESYSETIPIYYPDGAPVLYEYACLQGDIYNTGNTAQYAKDDGTSVELLNSEGTWYGCNADAASIIDDYTNTQLITDTTNKASCDVLGNYLCNYNPDTSSWEWYSTTTGTEEGAYVRDTLRYLSGETFALSTPVWAESEALQTQACCAGNTCWDGTQCVDEYTEHTYTDEEEEVVSICHQGTWTGPLETKYDWYYNTDGAAVDYCINTFACVCSSNEEDSTYCTSNEEYFNAGCTLTPYFYVGDHLCEQTTDSSVWTSRTKLLAFQLMQIAEGTDYILFCDKYSNTLNNYVDVESIAESINSFCVLKQDNTVTIGVTFNSEDAEEPMTVDANELLFESSNAFVDIIDENIDDCDSAVEATQTQIFGEYFSCDSSTNNLFYNNLLNALIYSKDGLTTITYPNMATYQTTFDNYKQQVVEYIADNEITNPAGNDFTEDLEAFNYVNDFNKIYYATDGIYGFEEIKYNGESDNRYYMAVIYTGVSPSCEQVYAPYETTATVHCSDNIILERSTSGSAYWTSLTAGLRAE